MTGLALGVLLQAAVLGIEAQPYSEAYKLSQGNDQPLVVLVGADWCPGCVTIKGSVLPSLMRRGKLRHVQLAIVNTDEDPALARRLMRGTSIPQLIVFSRADTGWQRQQFTGPQAEAQIAAAIARAVENQSKATKVASQLH